MQVMRYMSKPESSARLLRAALDRFDRNSASAFTGGIVTGRLRRANVDGLRKVLRRCVQALYNFRRAAVPVMVEQGGGQVLMFTSAGGARMTPRAPLYSSARAGATCSCGTSGRGSGKRVQVNAARTNFMGFPRVPEGEPSRGCG